MWLLLFIFTGWAILKLVVSFYNLLTNPVLKVRVGVDIPNEKISVLIPARNEIDRVGGLLNSLLKQEYKNLEIIVLDDDSADGTAELVEKYARKNKCIKLITGQPVPPGWLGKNMACYQLAQAAQGAYYFFLDADVEVSDGFFTSCIQKMKASNVPVLSVFNDQKMKSLGELATVPTMHYILLALLPVRLVEKTKNPMLSAASGQCMVFESENYDKEQWHKKVKGVVTEDITIFKEAKKAGFKVSVMLAGGLIKCRMYSGAKGAVNGFSKNLLAGFGNSIFGLLVFTTLECLFLICLFVFNPLVLFSVAITLISKVIVSYLGRQNIFLNFILHPVQTLALGLIAFLSIYKKLTRTNTWKGRLIDIQSV